LQATGPIVQHWSPDSMALSQTPAKD